MGDQTNVERQGRELEKDAPFPLTDVDKWVLSQTDEEFHVHTWDELREIVDVALGVSIFLGTSWVDQLLATNKLETLKRKPSDLRRYMAWTHEIKSQYGSMTNYLLQHRLPWGQPPFTYNSSTAFSNPSDFKILINDWPYGLSQDITHIVVWSKTPIPTDEKTGDVTGESRQIIRDFVARTFVKQLYGDAERVCWFKNWVQLQSVRALEHIHVLVRGATKEDLAFWTGKTES